MSVRLDSFMKDLVENVTSAASIHPSVMAVEPPGMPSNDKAGVEKQLKARIRYG
jgi:hypothetical protein